MSEAVLEKYFFNIGKSFYLSDEYLRESHQFSAIGHFGIGFLSCFMLSSRVVLETKTTGSNETIKMIFYKDDPYIVQMKESIEKFPFLHGTRIILEYDQVFPGVFSGTKSFRRYLNRLLIAEDYEVHITGDENYKIRSTNFKHKIECDEGEILYDTRFDHPNVVFDVVDYFSGQLNVYLVDDYGDYKEKFVEFRHFSDVYIPLKKKPKQVKRYSIADYVDKVISKLPIFYQERIVEKYNKSELAKLIFAKEDIFYELNSRLFSFITQNEFHYYQIPIIHQKNVLDSFVHYIKQYGMDEAIKSFNPYIENITVLCNGGYLTNASLLKVIDYHLGLNGIKDISYSDHNGKAIITPQRISYELDFMPVKNTYFRLTRDFSSFESNVYLNNILVEKESLSLPYALSDWNIKYINVNIKSNDYTTNLARNKLDEKARHELQHNIGKALYENLISKGNYDEDEKEVIQFILKKYYAV